MWFSRSEWPLYCHYSVCTADRSRPFAQFQPLLIASSFIRCCVHTIMSFVYRSFFVRRIFSLASLQISRHIRNTASLPRLIKIHMEHIAVGGKCRIHLWKMRSTTTDGKTPANIWGWKFSIWMPKCSCHFRVYQHNPRNSEKHYPVHFGAIFSLLVSGAKTTNQLFFFVFIYKLSVYLFWPSRKKLQCFFRMWLSRFDAKSI